MSNSGQTFLIPARGVGAVLLASDTFTGVDGTALESHTPDVGGVWTKHTASGAGSLVLDTNRLRNATDAVTRIYYLTTDPRSADYDVEATVVNLSANASTTGVLGRVDTATNTYYYARYATSGGAWQIFRFISGANTQIGSDFNQIITVGQSAVLTLRMRGATISLLVNGISVISGTDATITAKGFAGVRPTLTAAAGVGPHLDNFILRTA